MEAVNNIHVLDALDLLGYVHERVELKDSGVHRCYRKGDIGNAQLTVYLHHATLFTGVLEGEGMIVTGSKTIPSSLDYLPREVIVDRARRRLLSAIQQHEKIMRRRDFMRDRMASRDDFRCVAMIALEKGIISGTSLVGVIERLYGDEEPFDGRDQRVFTVWDVLKAFWGVKFRLWSELVAQEELTLLMIKEFGTIPERNAVV